MVEFKVTVKLPETAELPAQKQAASLLDQVVRVDDWVVDVVHWELVVFHVPAKLAEVAVVVPSGSQ